MMSKHFIALSHFIARIGMSRIKKNRQGAIAETT
jgi:hypothetical protein